MTPATQTAPDSPKIDRRRFNPGRPRHTVIGPPCPSCNAPMRPNGTQDGIRLWRCRACKLFRKSPWPHVPRKSER